jgi:hypothetical protein
MTQSSKKEARESAARLLEETFPEEVGDYVFLEEETGVRDFGWVFFYESREYVVSGDASRKLIGNAPIVVTHSGKAYLTGTAMPVDAYIAEMKDQGVLT